MNSLIYNDSQYKPGLFKPIFGILVSVLTLLVCMWFVGNFVDGLINSFVNIISLAIAATVLIKTTKIEYFLGQRVLAVSVISCVLIAFLVLIFSSTFVYNDFLSGLTNRLDHGEHTLMYMEMEIIATRLGEGMNLEQATAGLPLNQYYYVFVYATLFFVFGGVNITNMCIFSTLHTLICAVCMALIANRYGIKDIQKTRFIYFVSLFQPLFLATHNYNKVIIGEAFIMVAMYIYTYTYHNPNLNLIAFPVYAFLMWAVRLQYLVIAVLLCFLTIFLGRKKLNFSTVLGIALIFAIAIFVALKVNIIEYIRTELNFENYTEGATYGLSAIPMRFLRTLLPYFPFTNIFSDRYWEFNLFCIFQIVMNCTVWYFVVFDALQMKRMKQVFTNPIVIAGIGFILAGTFSALHTTYISVGTVLLTVEFEKVTKNRFLTVFMYILFILIILSFLYSMLGLTGTGISQLVV